MRSKSIPMKSNHSKNSRFFKKIFADVLHIRIIEHSLRKHYRHSSTRPKHIKCSLNEENVPFDVGAKFTAFLARKFILPEKSRFRVLPSKRRIGEKYIELKIM